MADDVEPCAGEKNKHVSMEDCEVVVKDDKPEETTTQTETDTKINVTETLEAINNIEEIEEDNPFMTMAAEGLSQFGRSADGTMQSFLSLTLQSKDLQSIEGISSYSHLQILDISCNNIEDLSPLSSLPFLISLDASHNNLKDVLNFKPPFGLREVNLSHNKIESMSDLESHKCLNKLILDYNSITEISGLQGCKRLKILSMVNNMVEKLSGLERLPLTYLNLSNNRIRRVENISTLRDLETLDLSYNSIRSLRGIQSHDLLHMLKLSNNELIDLSEIRYIRDLPLLRVLDLSFNPIQNLPDYRLSILLRIPRLTELDNAVVLPEEKVASLNLYQPCREVIAARNHMVNLLSSYQQPIKLLNSTLSSMETPYPMLVLTGPSGSCKRLLVKRLCQEFPNFFGQGVSFTTRDLRKNEKVPRESEVDGVDYHFVTKEDFERDAVAGKFVQTCEVYGCQYGVGRDAIEAVAKEGLACVLHMELEGVMVLKNTHFEPRYILILPETSKVHEDRMRAIRFYSEIHINQALERVSLYEEMNREHPGYFDMTICCDDIEESYTALKKIVMEYLGMSPVNSAVSLPLSCTHDSPSSQLTSTSHPTSGTNHERSFTGSPAKTWAKSNAPLQSKDSRNNSRLAGCPKSPIEAASVQRRFMKMQSATLGVTSTSQEQLLKLGPPLSATGIPTSWVYEDLERLSAGQRAFSAPNATFSEGIFDIAQDPDAEDESDSERGSDNSDLSSAHYMEAEDEIGSQTDRSSVASVLS